MGAIAVFPINPVHSSSNNYVSSRNRYCSNNDSNDRILKCVSLLLFRRIRRSNDPRLSRESTFPLGCSSSTTSGASADENFPRLNQESQPRDIFWKKWRENSAEMSAKLAKLGLAAVLAYGLFDGVTYTTFFVLAFLGYEKSTGKNPAANIPALLGIVILMWTGNNITRPFRIAGAAALAPAIDRGLRKIQSHFKLPRLVHAFALVVGMVGASCLSVVGLLILSRWGK